MSAIPSLAGPTIYTYDDLNRLVRASSDGAIVEYVYDEVGNLVRKKLYAVSTTPSSYDFGYIGVGASSAARTFTVADIGTETLQIGSTGFNGNDVLAFSLVNDNCIGRSLAPSGSCTLQVVFSPATAGGKNASLSVSFSNPDSLKNTIPLGGTGSLPKISVSPSSYDFGNVNTGAAGVQTFTVTNTSAGNVVTGTLQLTGTDATEFRFVDPNGCNAQTLTPGGSCAVQVAFSPTTSGSKSANLYIPLNDAGAPPLNAPLGGVGISYQLMITKSGTGTGSVSSSPAGTDCGIGCAAYNYGTSVTLTAGANTGSVFGSWSGCDVANGNQCTVAMNANKVVTATFTLNTYALTVARNGSGMGTVTSSPSGIDCGAACSYSFDYNTAVTLTATADASSTFTGWSGEGCSGTGTCVLTMNAARSVATIFSLGFSDLPKTGQTTCCDESGNMIDCAGTGQDGDLRAGVSWPNPRFADNGDGTITDRLTGLTWLKDGRCLGSRSWTAGLDAVASLNVNPAIFNCQNYTANYSDWRLPNINELESLINSEQSNSATWLMSQGFLNVQSQYWTSTTYARMTEYARFIYASDGFNFAFGKTRSFYIWAVRGSTAAPAELWRTGQTISYYPGDDGDTRAGVSWPGPRFMNNGGGTTTDNLTGLTFTTDANAPGPAVCAPATGKTWLSALNYIMCLNANTYLGYSDWRLPNKKELQSLIDFSQTVQALPFEHPFVSVQSNYWASTTRSSQKGNAWKLAVTEGVLGSASKTATNSVWPVRGGLEN